ncbi:MAG: dihydrodipicolinate synthase family protein [Clostridiales bacterium]|nr:dihydrodipicolinate synthase family protein [Clostridiales bacterium]
MKKTINFGAYPTMITPYNNDGSVDYAAVENLVEWYWVKGCHGIFAVCQSSEMLYLSLDDRYKIAYTVKNKADALARVDKSRKPMSIVASGHISYDPDDQAYEIKRISESGVDATVLITNRLDIENLGEDKWIGDGEKLLGKIPDDLILGLYECPLPYKRLLTPGMIDWVAQSGRFSFIKDTCCDTAVIKQRLERFKGTTVKLFNANAQTLLESLKEGGDGYCGIMCNFHPQLYVWLCENFDRDAKLAYDIHTVLSMCAFTEQLAYPCTAKYHLNNLENINMSLTARSCDARLLTPYHQMCIDQMKALTDKVYSRISNQ